MGFENDVQLLDDKRGFFSFFDEQLNGNDVPLLLVLPLWEN